MIIEKFLHSCLRITKGGRRILIDPGKYCFNEGLDPAALAPVDAVLFTHEHGDHYSPEHLRAILRPGTKVVCGERHARILQADGFDPETLREGEEREIAGFAIRVLRAPHADNLKPSPQNTGYFIDNTLLHPGDSFDFDVPGEVGVLALPYVASWAAFPMAKACAIRARPSYAIPIHDAYLKEYFREARTKDLVDILGAENIQVRPLTIGQQLEV